MKRTDTSESTTATPAARVFRKARRYGGVLLASWTAVTLPVSAHALHGNSPALIIAVGMVPAVPLLLSSMSFVCSYTLLSLLAVVRCFRDIDSAARFDDAYTWITNAPIAFLAFKQLDLPRRDEPPPDSVNTPVGEGLRASDPLPYDPPEPIPPGPPGAAQLEAMPVYYGAIVDSAVPPATAAVSPQPVAVEGKGKHRRPDVAGVKA